MGECIFCRIVAGEIPADRVWEDEHVLAFRDIQPIAPTHVLIIPKVHVESFADVGEAHAPFLASLARAIREVAAAEGVDATGYRLLANTGPDAGQEVMHLHVHLLGGRPLGPMLSRRDPGR